jgi:hypothetical protein
MMMLMWLACLRSSNKDGRNFCLFRPNLGSSKMGSTQGKAFGRNSIPPLLPPEGLLQVSEGLRGGFVVSDCNPMF